MGFADFVKTALEATPQGQAYQNAKATDVANQQKKEQAERDFADYVQSKGARPVVNGMVHRDWTAGNGSVIPNAIFDKAGNEGRQVISHKDPTTGQKIQWELGTPDEQIAHSAALKLSQQMLEKPIRDQTAQEATTNAGNTAGATTRATLAAQLAGQNTERQQRGVHLPQPVAEAYGLKPDEASGMIVLPEKLSELAQGGESVQNIKTQADLRTQQVEAAKIAAQERQKQIALQQLPGIQDQAGYDAVRKANPDGAADWPTAYDPNIVKSLIRRTISPEKQVELGILNLSDIPPEEFDKTVDKIIPPVGDTAKLNNRTKVLGQSARARGDLKGAQAIIKDASDQMGRTETAVATAKATAPIKISVAAGTDAAKLQNAGITEDDLQRAGTQYAITGEMPALGMGSGARLKIEHYAQQYARDSGLSPRDLAQAKAAYKGDTKSLENFQKQRDQIDSFEQTAGKNLDLFLQAASQIPDSGIPWLNSPMRSLDANVVGSANMAAVNAARQVANNEIAKVTSGGGLSGVLSDSARKEVSAFNPADATFAQTKAVAKVLKQDMQNRRESMDATLGEIRSRIGSTGAPATPTAPAATPAASKYKVGDTVMYQGKPHKVQGINPQTGKLILEP